MAASAAAVGGSTSRTEATKSPMGGSVINWSGQGLQKLGPTLSCDADTHTLILDKNQLIKLENLEKCKNLMQLSVANNRLVRMMGVAKLTQLRVLNLPHNSIGYVEGLKDIVHLEWLNLAGNNLKMIEQLNSCTSLQHLDLSDNNISQIGDISKLSSLKTLLLHGNIITSLRTAPACLPQRLAILSLAENEVRDLNEISFLASFPELEQLSIMNNPCVMATPSIPGFDYRPYIVSWCLSLKVLDGYVISQKESLKAEWLYSQGKGRSFRPGQHVPLVQYLASVCPLTTVFGLQTAEDAKLEKILHKQRLHQRQLMYQSQSDETPVSLPCNKEVPVTSEPSSPAHGSQIRTEREPVIQKNSWVRPRSNDDHSYAITNAFLASPQSERNACEDLYLEDIQTDEDKLNSSLLSSESTFMPVASGLSPLSPTAAELRLHGICIDTEYMNDTNLGFGKEINKEDEEKQEKTLLAVGEHPIKSAEIMETQRKDQTEGNLSISTLSVATISPPTDTGSCPVSSEDCVQCSHIEQLHIPEEDIIKSASPATNLEERSTDLSAPLCQKDDALEEMARAATKLQASWRGYYTRNHHPRAKEVRYEIRLSRMQDHIMHLTEEVKKLRKEKDEERLQRKVQGEALKFLWDQVRSIQEWQLSLNRHLSIIWKDGIPTSSALCPSELPIESSGLNQVLSPVASSTWLVSAAEACHQRSLPEFPDSGFHSCVTDQNCLNESQRSEESLTETNDSTLGTSLETVKLHEVPLSGCLSDVEEIQLSHGECSEKGSSCEQDNSLLQQYLKSVEQLNDADEKASCSNDTESTRPKAAVSLGNLAASGSQDAFASEQGGIGQASERCDLNAEIAEEKPTDCDSSFQALPVSITV
ncbi:centrosomal protein of 97 kDa [Eublepharis macularius]|uniref:Centrosomal protein of 97 kDa n=1 Tax=Eublepharis macularius TaxID=481883 RepID=A0AA97J4W5_EUBMA|nr:centrosomal protein of 97 kDa [Eublepharis macularius]